MRYIFLFVLVLASAAGGYLAWNRNPELRNLVANYLQNGEFITLEARFTAEQIMEQHRAELLGDGGHTYLEPSLKFHPYLLMDVKYSLDHKTREGIILWSLVDGEMVLDTE